MTAAGGWQDSPSPGVPPGVFVVLKALTIFSGNANRELAEAICRYVETPLGRAEVTRFSDGEIFVEIGENVRGVNCFVVQPTCSPVNDNLMELLIMIDALKRASAGSIIAVMPYFGYARQDRKSQAAHADLSAKLVADLLTAAGADRVLVVDLHAGQIQGFFNIPVDHLYAHAGADRLPEALRFGKDAVIVSPDAGGVERARAYSKRLDATLAIIDKRRGRPTSSEVMNIIGDVKGKDAIIVDDMIDTAGTLAPGGPGAHGSRRARGLGLRHARRALAARPSSASRSRRSRSSSSPTRSRCGPRRKAAAKIKAALGGAPPRRGDQAHPPRRFDLELVHLERFESKGTQIMEVGKLERRVSWRHRQVGRAPAARRRQDPGDLLRPGKEPMPLAVDPTRAAQVARSGQEDQHRHHAHRRAARPRVTAR